MESGRKVACWILGLSLIAVTVVVSIPARYGDAYWPIAVAELVLVGVSAWFAGGRQSFGGDDRRRRLAVAGLLLIAPFALFSLLPGLGPPDSLGSTTLEERRFSVLLINAMCIFGGCVVLRDVLLQEGERLFSGLAFAAAGIAAPLYVVFTAIQLADYRELDRKGLGVDHQSFTMVDDASIVLLFFGSVLNYLATIAFAQSLLRLRIVSGRTRTVYFVIAGTLLCFLIFRGLDFGGLPRALQHWYTVLAFFAGVPAVSWVLLSALGVIALSRAGDERT